jgi:hypothetical protein
MKNLFLIAFFLISLFSSAQKIGGFYSGTLFNDSTKMVQKYELALSEYRGKISGYSYVTFVSNDTFYYGIRKIRGNIVGDSLVVEDDKMIVNNFPERPAKGVGRVITIPLKGQDSLVVLNGRWKTNQTKKYYSVPGAIDLNRSQDSLHSPLIAHLKELNLIADNNYQNTKYQNTETETVAETKVKTEPDKTKIKTKNSGPKNKTGTAAVVTAAPAVLPYNQRKNKTLEAVDIASDSLVLAFYDNGVVDGDSISVYLNEVNIISKTRLASVATKKKVSVAGLTEIRLTLVAENLGTIPPNTGLLMIKDGENSYQINFSADMQTNATIVLKRKLK